MYKSIFLLFSALTLAHPAFASVVDSPSDRDGWFDITVLKAHVRWDWTLQAFDQVERCDKTRDEWIDEGRSGRNHYETFDCTRHIEANVNGTAFKRLPKWEFRNGYLTTNLENPLIEVYTIVPLDRLASADFLGFSESYMGGRINLFKANGSDGQTREAEQVRLKDGRIGVVHRWIAEFQQNGWGGFKIRNVPFKPVLVRKKGGDLHRYWDNFMGEGFQTDYSIRNYIISATGYQEVAPNVIDRTADLLE